MNTESAPSTPSTETPASGARLSFELMIVDNGSTDETVPMLRSEFPLASLILNGKNDGFARPLNRAIRQSTGLLVLALNPDTIVQPGALNELVRYMDSHPEVGICGPKVLNRNGTLQKAYRRGVSRP